jgi:colicin import membrane protein
MNPLRNRIQAEPGTGKAFVWALGMHLLLFGFLTFGLSWKSQTPAGLEAEIWDEVPVIKNALANIDPKIDVDEKADIALKKKKEAVKKPEPKAEVKAAKKVDPKELQKQKAEQEKLAKQKQEQAKAKAKADAERKEALAQAQARSDQLARIRSAAGKEGAAGGRGGVVGDGVGGGGNAKPRYQDYVNRVLIPLITWPYDQNSPIKVFIKVSFAPDGTILSKEITKSSGDTTWDKAVMNALDRLGKMPKDESGKIPGSYINLVYGPRELR